MNHTKPNSVRTDGAYLPSSCPVSAAPESLETAVPIGSLALKIVERLSSERVAPRQEITEAPRPASWEDELAGQFFTKSGQ